ncbi:FAD-binding protein [Phenylobacterium sp. LjRoot219]|uniref:FAD-binding protein n=1 Tax=Phenylobacterium sp. LjRoot219 TaxID=3342283 RepID=UPI003ED00677
MIRNLPARWDLEADVVAVGSGIGGLAAAITSHDHGATSLVLERAEQVGGVTAYSLGEVWVPGNRHARALGIEDSVESGVRYVNQLSMGYADDTAVLNQAVHAPVVLDYFEQHIGLQMRVIRNCPDYYYGYSNDGVAEGRLLEVEPFAAEQLGDWRTRTRVSPHVLYGLTHEDIFENGGAAHIARWDFTRMGDRLVKDERCLGPGLIAYFVKGALDREIPMHTGVTVEELISDGERVLGVRATRDGQNLFVKANRGVVLAVSSYERNPDFAKTLGQQLDVESVVMPEIDGSHFRLAGPFGARIARVPDVTMLGFHIPGEELEGVAPLWRNTMAYMGLPHSIIVNRAGKRFANEAFYRSIFYAVDAIDGATQTHPNFPCWLILDSQAREKYPLASIMPGQPLPEGVGAQANSIAELASEIGVHAPGLQATIEAFNRLSDRGEDPEFGRGTSPWGAWMCGDRYHTPNPNLGPLVKAPFYAVELKRLASSAIASTGLMGDAHCRVMGWDGAPIAGLYVAGNSMARLDNGALMQSGMSNARGMTHGYLAGRHAAGKPSQLLERARQGFPA